MKLKKLLRRFISETIRKCGSKWCLYTKDGSKILGKHDTKKDAIGQERAIYANENEED